MDIRNFFGSRKVAAKQASENGQTLVNTAIDDCESTVPAKRPVSKVIKDDDEELENRDVRAERDENLAAAHVVDTTSKPKESCEPIRADVPTATAKLSGGIPKDLENFITWKPGENVPYLALVDIFESISKVSGRIEKEGLFSKLFRAVILTTPGL